MRVTISARWQHDPDHHLMMVDDGSGMRQMLIDFDGDDGNGIRVHAVDPNSLTGPDVLRHGCTDQRIPCRPVISPAGEEAHPAVSHAAMSR
jgi:hypothetical protein